jgi:hypothetical protein
MMSSLSGFCRHGRVALLQASELYKPDPLMMMIILIVSITDCYEDHEATIFAGITDASVAPVPRK